jgi:hypothetical protein
MATSIAPVNAKLLDIGHVWGTTAIFKVDLVPGIAKVVEPSAAGAAIDTDNRLVLNRPAVCCGWAYGEEDREDKCFRDGKVHFV